MAVKAQRETLKNFVHRQEYLSGPFFCCCSPSIVSPREGGANYEYSGLLGPVVGDGSGGRKNRDNALHVEYSIRGDFFFSCSLFGEQHDAVVRGVILVGRTCFVV